MPTLPDDYWIEIPGGRYTLGVLPDEARRLAKEIAAWIKARGPLPSANDWKNMERYLEIEEETGNPEWVQRYLLARYPAREVEIPSFAIARRPVTNDLYRRFMQESGESPPDTYGLTDAPLNEADDYPARGVTWAAALKFASWAGARLPFEAEWERAARGPERRLYPWGDAFEPAGRMYLEDWLDTPALDPRAATLDGVLGMIGKANELCLDLWSDPQGFDPEAWGGQPVPPWYRVSRGEEGLGRLMTSAVARDPFSPSDVQTAGQIRLVRSDGRVAPPAPPMPRPITAAMEVRANEHDHVAPALRMLSASRIAEAHTVTVWLGRHRGLPSKLVVRLGRGRDGYTDDVGAKFPEPNQAELDAPDRHRELAPSDPVWRRGLLFAAVSRESFRRAVPEHGIFLWSLLYRIADDGRLRARPVAACRMAYDKQLHRFELRFRPDEPDTAIEELTAEMLQRSVLEAFEFYDAHADADRSPF